MIIDSRMTRNEVDVLRSALVFYTNELERQKRAARSERQRADQSWRLFTGYQLLESLAGR